MRHERLSLRPGSPSLRLATRPQPPSLGVALMGKGPWYKHPELTYAEWLDSRHRQGYAPKNLSRLKKVWGVLSEKELCERFGVTRGTLYRHAKRLGLKFRKYITSSPSSAQHPKSPLAEPAQSPDEGDRSP